MKLLEAGSNSNPRSATYNTRAKQAAPFSEAQCSHLLSEIDSYITVLLQRLNGTMLIKEPLGFILSNAEPGKGLTKHSTGFPPEESFLTCSLPHSHIQPNPSPVDFTP